MSPARQTQPLESPVYAKVAGEAPVKPAVGRCDELGCMEAADESGCLYCGELVA